MALEVTRREQEGIAILELRGRLKFGPEDTLLNDEIRHALAARRLMLQPRRQTSFSRILLRTEMSRAKCSPTFRKSRPKRQLRWRTHSPEVQ